MRHRIVRTTGVLVAIALVAALVGPVAVNASVGPCVVMFETSKGQELDDFDQWIPDMEAAGYTVTDDGGDLGNIGTADVLIVPGLKDNYSINSPYTAAEAAIIANFVNAGGKLILLSEWSSFTPDTEEIATAVGVDLDEAIIPWTVFDSTNFNQYTPIFAGVTNCEFFYSTVVLSGGAPILWTDDDEVQATVAQHGLGTAIVTADANWCMDDEFTAPSPAYGAYDNAVLAMNMLRYLCPNFVAISDDLIPQEVEKPLAVRIKIHPTIYMDTFDPATGQQLDELFIGCLNPYNNDTSSTVIGWNVKSNLPFWKTLSFKGMATDYMLDSPMPDGSIVPTRVQDEIGSDQWKFYLSDDKVFTDNEEIKVDPDLGWAGPIVGNEEVHEDTEYLKWQIGIKWCDSAGYYHGLITLDAHQN